jgi:ferredoxin
MPAQVVVVKRSRRRAFAILRSLPAWLRAVASNLRRRPSRGGAIELESFPAYCDASLLAPERQSGVMQPRMRDEVDLGGCASCRICVEVCPTRALERDVASTLAVTMPAPTLDSAADRTSAPSMDGLRFELDPGRCIGCGDCARVCPEALLEMAIAPVRVGPGAMPVARDLIGATSERGSGVS